MATSENSMCYRCLLDFQKEIQRTLVQTQMQAEVLTRKARQKGLVPPGTTSYETVRLISYCIENVGNNEQLYPEFLAFLSDAGQDHLVRRIKIKFQKQQSSVKLRRDRAPPTSTVNITEPSRPTSASYPTKLPPLSASKSSTASHDHRLSQRTKGLSEDRETQQPSLSTMERSSLFSEQEISVQESNQENEAKKRFALLAAQQSTLTNNEKPFDVVREPETVNIELEEKIQELKEDKVLLEKKMEKKDNEIRKLEAEKRDKVKELEAYKAKIAELEKKLQQKDDEFKEREIFFSKQEEQMRLKYERKLNDLRKQISEEKEKTKRTELEIEKLEKQVVQKELQKVTLTLEYEGKKRAVEIEREKLKADFADCKVELAQCKVELANQKCKAAEEEKEEVERKRKAAEEEKEEEERRRRAAERGHRESLDKIEEMKKLLKLNGIVYQ